MTRSIRGSWPTGVGALLALLVTSIAGPGQLSQARSAGLPGGLPAHFGFGLSAPPDSAGIYGWMPDSNVPWDYAYQYLSAGVNTGHGWETWDANGAFPLYYAQGAASHRYIPVFSYYELLQSNGTCGGCGEAQKDLSNLNNAGTMRSYFQNFTLLMQRLGPGTYGGVTGFGKTAIVQVEPDLSGYAEQAVLANSVCYGFCTGSGNNPALLRASMARSATITPAAYQTTAAATSARRGGSTMRAAAIPCREAQPRRRPPRPRPARERLCQRQPP
jgi:hypothetical protein